jgi:hypothetical protein
MDATVRGLAPVGHVPRIVACRTFQLRVATAGAWRNPLVGMAEPPPLEAIVTHTKSPQQTLGQKHPHPRAVSHRRQGNERLGTSAMRPVVFMVGSMHGPYPSLRD